MGIPSAKNKWQKLVSNLSGVMTEGSLSPALTAHSHLALDLDGPTWPEADSHPPLHLHPEPCSILTGQPAYCLCPLDGQRSLLLKIEDHQVLSSTLVLPPKVHGIFPPTPPLCPQKPLALLSYSMLYSKALHALFPIQRSAGPSHLPYS